MTYRHLDALPSYDFLNGEIVCNHLETRTDVPKDGGNYLRLFCRSCGKFLRWCKNPDSPQVRQENEDKVYDLLRWPIYNDEKEFIDSIYSHIGYFGDGAISAADQARFNGIWTYWKVRMELYRLNKLALEILPPE